MSNSSTLLRHTWPSSRRSDENYISFEKRDDCVLVCYSALWDAEKDETDTVDIHVSKTELYRVVEQLLQLHEFKGGAFTIRGTGFNARLKFERRKNEVRIDLQNRGLHVSASFSVEQLSVLKTNLEKHMSALPIV